MQSNNFPREPRFPSKNFYSIRLVYLPLSLSLSLSVYLFILSNCLLQEEQTIPNLQYTAFHRNLHRRKEKKFQADREYIKRVLKQRWLRDENSMGWVVCIVQRDVSVRLRRLGM